MYRILIVVAVAALFAVMSVEAYLRGNSGYRVVALISGCAYFAGLLGAVQLLANRRGSRR